MLSPEIFHKSPRSVGTLAVGQDDVADVYENLDKLGIHISERVAQDMMDAYGMDSLVAGITTSSITTPLQFLQSWLPGTVRVNTGARKADQIMGYTVAGNFEDEEVVQMMLENDGMVQPYGDLTNIPLSDYNQVYERRSIVRFEAGSKVGYLESIRSAKVRIDAAAEKRNSVNLLLEINRNKVAFYGYNSGSNRTYGYLNDPSLPAYVTVATGATSSSKLWSLKTMDEICDDLRTAFALLQTQSQDLINPEDTELSLVVPTNSYTYLTKINSLGISVRDWLTKNYPKVRIVSAPELNAANSSANVFYVHADKVEDGSSDNGRVIDQIVPSKFQMVGVAKMAKTVDEDYAQSLAGVIVKRPYAVVRYTGI